MQDELSDLLAISQVIHESPILSGNTLVRKYATKLTSRVGLRLLPGAPSASRKNCESFRLHQFSAINYIFTDKILSTGQTAGHVDLQPEGFDVPSDVEDILQTLFEALQYKVSFFHVHCSTILPIFHFHRTLSFAGQLPRGSVGSPNVFPRTSQIKFWRCCLGYSKSIQLQRLRCTISQLSQKAHGTAQVSLAQRWRVTI